MPALSSEPEKTAFVVVQQEILIDDLPEFTAACDVIEAIYILQAVSTYSILQDPGLCEFLQGQGDKNGVDARDWEGNKLTVTCTPLTTTSQNQLLIRRTN